MTLHSHIDLCSHLRQHSDRCLLLDCCSNAYQLEYVFHNECHVTGIRQTHAHLKGIERLIYIILQAMVLIACIQVITESSTYKIKNCLFFT